MLTSKWKHDILHYNFIMGGNSMKKTILTVGMAVFLATTSVAQTPTLSEVEQLKIQVLNLQYALKAEQEKSANLTVVYGQCQSTLLKDTSGLEKTTKDLQNEITKNHEGFDFDITTGKFSKKESVEKK